MYRPKWPCLLMYMSHEIDVGQVVVWVEFPIQRRLCLIFMSGVGLPDIHDYSTG